MTMLLHQSAWFPSAVPEKQQVHISLQAYHYLLTFEQLLSLSLTDYQRGNTGQDMLPVHFMSLQDLLQLADQLLCTECHEHLEEQ